MKPHPPPPDWRQTNPDYEESPVRVVVINGVRCVEVDGGKLYDLAMLGREPQPKKKGG